MNIFLAFPFAGLCDKATGEVRIEFREFFNKLKKIIQARGHTYFLAHEREDWGALYKGPMECTPVDYQGVKDCDFLIVVPGNPISGGVHVEIGWASALGKEMHIFLEKDGVYSPVVHGICSITKAKYYTVDKFPGDDLFNQIAQVLISKENEGK